MPIKNYGVDFPDGKSITVQGPDDLSDAQVFALGTQQRAMKEGQIQTTWFGGAAKQMGQERAANTALLGGAGILTGAAPVVAAAPLAARWLEYATKKLMGDNPATPSAYDQTVDAASGVAGAYGPAAVSGSAEWLAGKTVAHQLANGQWVKGLTGSGILPWAGRTVAEGAQTLAQKIAKPLTPEAISNTAKELINLLPTQMRQKVIEEFGSATKTAVSAEMAPAAAATSTGNVPVVTTAWRPTVAEIAAKGSTLKPEEQDFIKKLWDEAHARSTAIGRTYPNPEFVPRGLESNYPGQGH